MADHVGEIVEVQFQGFTVECQSLDDAIAFRAADRILANEGACDESPVRIDQIADALAAYGHTAAAECLAHIASRMRALQFLVGSVRYERPKHAK